ncbi:MAG: hypothetical protein R6U51_10565 [Anaerolineales bacterium]
MDLIRRTHLVQLVLEGRQPLVPHVLFQGQLLVIALGPALYWFIDRCYKNRYGQARPKQEDRLRYVLMQILAGALGLAAFWADTRYLVPASLIGLVFAAGFTCEYLRTARAGNDGRRLYTLAFAALITLVSLSPLFGLGPWWRVLGMRGQLVGVIVVVSGIVLAAGALDHFYLRSRLPVEGH